ncbi:hypothetical protein ACU3L3_07165 [Priestia endophytica]
MDEILNGHNDLPDEIPELHPYHAKIYCIKLDEDTQRHVYVITKLGVYRFKSSLSYWVNYFNRCGCKLVKVHRYKAINLDKLTGYGWDNAVFGDWWVILDSFMRFTISKTFYNHLNKSEYRELNMSVKLRKRSF